MRATVISIVVDALGKVPKGLERGLKELETGERTRGDNPNYSIVEISQYTEKGAGESREIALTQTLIKAHQLTPV